MKKLIIVFGSAVFVSMVLAISTCSIGYASSDAYNSGHHHGCNDADKPVSERYINEADKGPSQHTGEFMDGCHQGFHRLFQAEWARIHKILRTSLN